MIKQKNFLLILLTLFLSTNISQARGLDTSSNFDKGLIYSGTRFPQSAGMDCNLIQTQKLEQLKKGESATINILGLIETGDASIDTAAKNGNIKKICYIDIHTKSIFIFWTKTTVTVYGE